MVKVAILGIIFTLLCGGNTHAYELGVVGDSSITGAAADPRLDANLWTFGKNFVDFLVGNSPLGKTLDLENSRALPHIEDYSNPGEFGISVPIGRPVRIFFSESEVTAQKTRNSHGLDKLGSRKVDMEEYSFAYMVGRGLGLPNSKIYFVAQDGKRVGVIATQFQRFFQISEIRERGTLPDLIFVFFTANNLCHEENLTRTVEQSVGYFRDSLDEQFQTVFSKFKPNKNGTRIILFAPMNVTQIFDNPELMDNMVRLQDKVVRCRDFRRPHSETQSFIGKKILEGIENMCPSVLKTDLRDTKRIEHLKGIISGFAETEEDLVQSWQTKLPPGFTFDFFKGTFEMKFGQGDTTNDCFHPGIRAHERIAREVLKELSK